MERPNFEITFYQTARRVPRQPLSVKTIAFHIPIYWEMEVRNKEDVRAVRDMLGRIQFDGREKTIKLRVAGNVNIAPTPLHDDMTLRTNVMEDLRRLLHLRGKVTVFISIVD